MPDRLREDELSGRGDFRGVGPKGYVRSDERIREDLCDRLTDDPAIDPSNVEVRVSGCEVTLSGTVDSQDEERRARETAESVPGVRKVDSRIKVEAAQGGRTTGTAPGMAGEAPPAAAEREQA